MADMARDTTEVDYPTIFQSIDQMDPSLEYNMKHRRRGTALIFNHEHFYWYLGLPSRGGTNADKMNLERRLRDLGFDVSTYDNLKSIDIMEIIHKEATSDHSDADCFLCIFLSHGENNHVFAYDGKINLQDITARFRGDKCSSLVGKPKIFIIQGTVHNPDLMETDVGAQRNIWKTSEMTALLPLLLCGKLKASKSSALCVSAAGERSRALGRGWHSRGCLEAWNFRTDGLGVGCFQGIGKLTVPGGLWQGVSPFRSLLSGTRESVDSGL
ncbi:caspase-6-like isoform X2 [Mobula hypostoma]|uniref:caspase-6-like isoform X2 n=1 Tax=Mobula hypostoma TaxID=723540 RepID=UPI002FC3D8E7